MIRVRVSVSKLKGKDVNVEGQRSDGLVNEKNKH